MKAFVLLSFLYFSITVVGQDASSREVRSSTVPTSANTSPAPVELIDVNTIFAGINRPYSITPPIADGIEAQLKESELHTSTRNASRTRDQATPFAGGDADKANLAPKSNPIKKEASAPVSKKTTSKSASKDPQRQNEHKKGRPIQDALRTLFSNGNSRFQQPSVNLRTSKTSHQLSRSRKPLNLGAE